MWQVRAADPSGLVLVPAKTAYQVSWTLPDFGYTLQSAMGLKGGAWVDSTNGTVVIGKTKSAFVPSSSLPAVQGGYFRLFKP